ncbi:hypothetical protein R5R51_09155 [Oenococcus oeni]
MIIIIGILLGAFTGWGLLTIADRHSRALLVTTSTFGALGAVAANQLLSWGLTVWGISILPVLAGSIVLPLVSIYGFYFGKNYFKKLRAGN